MAQTDTKPKATPKTQQVREFLSDSDVEVREQCNPRGDHPLVVVSDDDEPTETSEGTLVLTRDMERVKLEVQSEFKSAITKIRNRHDRNEITFYFAS